MNVIKLKPPVPLHQVMLFFQREISIQPHTLRLSPQSQHKLYCTVNSGWSLFFFFLAVRVYVLLILLILVIAFVGQGSTALSIFLLLSVHRDPTSKLFGFSGKEKLFFKTDTSNKTRICVDLETKTPRIAGGYS